MFRQARKRLFPSPMEMTRTSGTRLPNCNIFDREMKTAQKGNIDAEECLIHKNVATQMVERRSFVKMQTPVVLELGAGSGWYLRELIAQKRHEGIKQYIQTDSSEDRLNRNYAEVKAILPPGMEFVQICADEDQEDPFGVPPHTVDCVVSCLSLHWVNFLDTLFMHVRNLLKPDAFFLGSMFGGNTLFELRAAFAMTEQEVVGGMSPHVSAMLDGAAMSQCLQTAGFHLPTIDLDRHVLTYRTAFHLMEHLRAMGENGASILRNNQCRRELFAGAAAVYDLFYGKGNLIPATFEVFHFVAWAPAKIVHEPLTRGSGEVSLKAISSTTHKRFTEVLQEVAKNPDDDSLQVEAEELFAELKEMHPPEPDGVIPRDS